MKNLPHDQASVVIHGMALPPYGRKLVKHKLIVWVHGDTQDIVDNAIESLARSACDVANSEDESVSIIIRDAMPLAGLIGVMMPGMHGAAWRGFAKRPNNRLLFSWSEL